MTNFQGSIDILKKAQNLDREVYLNEEAFNEIPLLREKLEQKDLLIEVLKNDLAAKEEERQISRDRWLPSRP